MVAWKTEEQVLESLFLDGPVWEDCLPHLPYSLGVFFRAGELLDVVLDWGCTDAVADLVSHYRRLASQILAHGLSIKTKLQQRIFTAPLARCHESNWDLTLSINIGNISSALATLGHNIPSGNGYGWEAAEVGQPDIFHALKCVVCVVNAKR
ncbi:hypothetical protein HG530_009444 [Fusarium avenaceum]|nr:hypothetical protein HG530_009444 [Fusarium avenaceum]